MDHADPDHFASASEALARMLGFDDVQELLARPIASLYADPSRRSQSLSDLRREGLLRDYEVDMRRKDGELVRLALTITVVPGDGLALPRHLGVAVDVTWRQRAQAALLANEHSFRSMFESAQIGIVVADTSWRIRHANPAFCEMLGTTEADLVARGVDAISHPDDVGEGHRQLREVLDGQRKSVDLEKRYLARDGRVVWARTTVSVDRSSPNGPWRTVALVQDITQRKQIETELARIEKLESLGVLAGGIAHDFNNVLTGIVGNIELAAALVEPDSPSRVRFQRAAEAAMRARALTQQLLTFAQGAAPVRRLLHLNDLVREAGEFAVAGSRCRFDCEVSADLWPVEADEGQLQQVLHNLVINAVQAMPDGGTVRLTARNVLLDREGAPFLPPGPYVAIGVTDMGTGIPDHLLGRVFDPFFTTKKGGTGLGLATAWSIIKKHGGHIAVDSAVNQGTTFFVHLPAPIDGRAPAQPELPDLGGARGRVLVMDDEDVVADVIAQILRDDHFEVVVTADGVDAVRAYQDAIVQGRRFDVVVLDLTVPGGLGGLATLERLLSIDPTVRAIVASGYSTDPVLAGPETWGFVGVLTKPFGSGELRRVMQEVLAGQ